MFFVFTIILVKPTGFLTDICPRNDEIGFVKRRLIILCQSSHFPKYSILKDGVTLSRKSSLLTLNPFIDSNSFLRVNGRLSRSLTLTYHERLPKLLPYFGHFTRLYLEHS